MNKQEETYHLIEKYLNNELFGEELIQFENELARNTEFALEVETQQLSREITIQASNFELRNKIKSGINQYDKEQKYKKYIKYGAAGLLVLGGLITYFSINKKEETIEKTPIIEHEVLNTSDLIETSAPVKPEKPKNSISTKPIKENVVAVTTKKQEEEKETIELIISPTIDTIKPLEKENPTTNQNASSELKEHLPKSATPIAFDCSKLTITAQPKITTPCIGEANGSVTFSQKNINGGKPPYIVQYKNEVASVFRNLYAGYYNFTIIDNNNCLTKIEVEIEEKECLKTSHTLNLTFESEIVLHKANGTSTKLTIFDKNGIPIFENITDDDVIWDGTNTSGNLQRSGLYYYIIKTNSETINGQVTILN